MKRLLILISFTVLALTSSAQKYQDALLYGENKNRADIYYLLGIPNDTFAIPSYPQDKRRHPHVAAKDNTIYLWDTTAYRWNAYMPGGSGGGLSQLGNTGTLWLTRLNDSTYKADSAAISGYLLRRKDSAATANPLGYVTLKILNDSLNKFMQIDTTGKQNRYVLFYDAPSGKLKFKIDSTAGGSSGVTSVGTGYGLSGGTITATGTILVDSATLAGYMLRRKDSLTGSNPLGYLTQYSPQFTGDKLLYGGLHINPGPTYDTSWVVMSSQSNPWMFFMNGTENKIGINNGYPATTMHIKNGDNSSAPLLIENNSSNTGVQVQVAGPMPGIAFNNADGLRVFAKPPGNNDFEIFNTAAWGAGTTFHKWFADGGYSTLGSIASGSISLTASAQLALTSTDKGFLPPRLTTTQRNAIASPAFGLMIYNTTDSAYQYYRASGWAAMGSGGSGAVTDSLKYVNDELLLYQTGASDLNVHITPSILNIDSLYNPLAGQQNDTAWRMKSLRIQKDGSTITPTTTDSTLNWNIVTVDTTTVPLITFSSGIGFAVDTALVTDSSILGSLFTGQYEYTIKEIHAVIKGNSGDSVVLKIVYNDTFNVDGTKINGAGISLNNRYLGNTFTVSTNRTVSTNSWLWIKPEAVIVGKKPKYISVTLLGYKTYIVP